MTSQVHGFTAIPDIPETDTTALDLVTRIGLLLVYETARVQKGYALIPDVEHLFAVRFPDPV